MSGRGVWAVAVAFALAPGLASADKAQRRDGGSGSSSSASSRQPSSSKTGSTSSKTGSSSTKTGSSSGSSSRATKTGEPATAAQRRQPRPGTGSGNFDDYSDYGYRTYRPYYPYGYGYGYGYRGYYYSPFYSPMYRYGYGWYSPYYSGSPTSAPTYSAPEDESDFGSVRVLVRPEKARVYVDGYYAGVVDDYDGVFQRLRVEPGPHEITFRLDVRHRHDGAPDLQPVDGHAA